MQENSGLMRENSGLMRENSAFISNFFELIFKVYESLQTLIKKKSVSTCYNSSLSKISF